MARHSAEWWAQRVEELSRDGDAAEIARKHGVCARTLVWWRSELARRARRSSAASPRLLPVVLERPIRGERRALRRDAHAAGIEVVVEIGAARVTARGALSADHLAAVVAAVRGC